MPFSTVVNLQATIDGTLYTQTSTVTSNSQEIATPSVAGAKSGTLTTRTDDNTGTFTMASGHGFSTSDKVDVFWSGGSRRQMDATVTGDSVVLDGGSGDVLPAATTAITAMTPTSVSMAFTGNDIEALAASCPLNVSGWVVFKASGGSDIAVFRIPAGEVSKVWASGLGITNPLASATVATVEFSHDQGSATTMTATVVF